MIRFPHPGVPGLVERGHLRPHARGGSSMEHATDPAIELPQHYIEVGGSTCLGMKLCSEDNSVTFRDPVIPLFLDHVLGSSMIDVKLQRHGEDVTVNFVRLQSHAGEVSRACPHHAHDARPCHMKVKRRNYRIDATLRCEPAV